MSTLHNDIDKLELSDMDEFEISHTIAGLSIEGMKLRKARKDVRYRLYRIQTEVKGGPASEASEEFKKRFEKQKLFDGWKFFGITWDVAMDDPFRCVHRDKSTAEEWNELVAATFPRIEPDGKVVYPDINVRKKVEAHIEERKKAKSNE